MHVLLCMPSSACLRHLRHTDGTAVEQKRFNFSLRIVSALLIGVAVSLGVFGCRVPYVGVLCGIFWQCCGMSLKWNTSWVPVCVHHIGVCTSHPVLSAWPLLSCSLPRERAAPSANRNPSLWADRERQTKVSLTRKKPSESADLPPPSSAFPHIVTYTQRIV